MSALSEIPVYWLNFALHTLLVSAFAWSACRMLRDARRRAFAAVVGVMAIVSLPWLTAIRPFTQGRQRVMEFMPPAAAADASGWTIRVEDVAMEKMPVAAVAPPVAPGFRSIGWSEAIMILWLAGAAVGIGVIAVRQCKLISWDSGNRGLMDDEWQAIGSLEFTRNQVRVCGGRVSPCVIGFFRVRVIIPSFLFVDPEDLKLHWAVRHESEHLRSGDSRVALLLSFAQAALWWNPFVRALCDRWAEDRERVCDARATEGADSRQEYGSFLLDLTEQLPAAMKGMVPMATSLTARRMKKRLQAILRGDRVKENPVAFRLASCLLIGTAGMLASFAGIEKAGGAEELSPIAGHPPAVTPGEPAAFIEVSGVRDASEAAENPGDGPAQEKKAVKVPSQVKMTTTFLKTDVPILQSGEILDVVRHGEVMLRYAGAAGVETMTPPSVSMRVGQKASLVMIRTAPGDAAKDFVPGDTRKVPFIGLSLEMMPEMKEGRISMSIDCLFNFAPGRTSIVTAGQSWPDTPPENFDWKTVKSVAGKATRSMKSGETLVLALEGMEGGKQLTGLFTVQALDLTGRPVDDSGELLPTYDEVPAAWAGRVVNLSAAIIELPDSGKLASYWFGSGSQPPPGSVLMFYPSRHFSRIVAEAAAQPGGRRVRGLRTMPVREKSVPVSPWKDDAARMEIGFTGTRRLPVRIALPEIGEVKTNVNLGDINSCELNPGAGGRRRMLLFALDEPGK